MDSDGATVLLSVLYVHPSQCLLTAAVGKCHHDYDHKTHEAPTEHKKEGEGKGVMLA